MGTEHFRTAKHEDCSEDRRSPQEFPKLDFWAPNSRSSFLHCSRAPASTRNMIKTLIECDTGQLKTILCNQHLRKSHKDDTLHLIKLLADSSTAGSQPYRSLKRTSHFTVADPLKHSHHDLKPTTQLRLLITELVSPSLEISIQLPKAVTPIKTHTPPPTQHDRDLK